MNTTVILVDLYKKPCGSVVVPVAADKGTALSLLSSQHATDRSKSIFPNVSWTSPNGHERPVLSDPQRETCPSVSGRISCLKNPVGSKSSVLLSFLLFTVSCSRGWEKCCPLQWGRGTLVCVSCSAECGGCVWQCAEETGAPGLGRYRDTKIT